MTDKKMFFVLNGLVNGDITKRAVRKYAEQPEELLDDGWWIAPTAAAEGYYILTSAEGPYNNSKEAMVAQAFLRPYADGLSVTQAIEFHCEKRGIKPSNLEGVNGVLLTLLVELVEIQDVLKVSSITDTLIGWDQRMAEPGVISEYI